MGPVVEDVAEVVCPSTCCFGVSSQAGEEKRKWRVQMLMTYLQGAEE